MSEAEPITPTSSVTALRIPMIKKGEYDLWSMKMRQYIAITDHILWDIITNGDQTTTDPASSSVPKTSLAANARRNNEKALNILLSAILVTKWSRRGDGKIGDKREGIKVIVGQDSDAYKTYYAIASGAEPPKSRKNLKKSDSTISSEESPSKKKSAKAKRVLATKPKPTKKKAHVKADKGKGVPNEQHHKTTGADEGTGTLPGGEEKDNDDDENDSEDESNNGDNEDDGNDDDDSNDDDNDETDSDRIESDRIKIPILNQSTTEYYKEEEKIDDEEKMDEEEDDAVTKELYNDVNENLGNRDVDMTDSDQANNEIASLMDTIARHATTVPEITSIFTTTIPPPPPFFNPIPQQATPTLTPTTSEATTLFPSLLDFSSVFKFNDRVTSLEKDLSEIKQVDQYAQALSSIPAIVDHYIDNKLREAIQKAILKHNLDCREEAQAEKRDYIELINTLMRNILKEEKNVTESLEATVLARSSSQPKSTYEAAASLSEFDLTKILIDKMEKNNKSTHAEEPSHTVDDLGVQQDQEFDTGNNDEQPVDKEVSKADWFKKPKRPPTPDSDWNKRQHVDSQPPQTWIS
ncbi:hypothetical protein Tco_0642445 [Tanacetum coccineum]